MRTGYRFLIATLGAIVLIFTGISGWLFFYTGDLPDVHQLSRFAPNVEVVISDPCLAGSSTVIPFDQIGKTFRAALAAAEPAWSTSNQIARGLLGCDQRLRPLNYQLNSLRLVWQIRRQFSDEQVLTVYVNRAYFGPEATGVKNASLAYFHKDPDALNVAEAALLAGLLRSPEAFSPYKHPERALQRRGQVLQAMVSQGAISGNEAENAERTPILSR